MIAEHVEVLAAGLASAGIRCAYGVTGSGSSLGLICQLQDRGVEYYPVGHEAAAAMMAGASCRDGRCRAAAVSIKGPGFANLLAGTLSNKYEGRPAFTISEAYGPSDPSYQVHKRLDHDGLCRAVTKGYAIADGTDDQVRRLAHHAETEFPGPVHVDLCRQPVIQELRLSENDPSGTISERDAESVLQQIRNSSRPAALLGSLACRAGEALNWTHLRLPVVTTAAARGVCDESGPYYGGIVTGEIGPLTPEESILSHSDLVIAFGLRNVEMIRPATPRAPLIVIDAVGAPFHDGFKPAAVLSGANWREAAALAVSELLRKEWGQEIVARHWGAVMETALAGDWLPGPVFQLLQGILGDRVVLVLDTGFFCTVGETIWRPRGSDGFCGSPIGRFMGTAIPTAIGASICNRSKPVVCVMGDGGISPYIGEIKLAVSENLPILFILMSDGRYGSVSAFAPGTSAVQRATVLARPSWWRALEGMGLHARTLSSLGGVRDLVEAWRREPAPFFLELTFDPDRYQETAKRLR
jgi:thiamine pyrophosphate-dependent acetolactate synthase large subunit-like protein